MTSLPLIIVGNKIDVEKKQVTKEEGLLFSKKLGASFMETSAESTCDCDNVWCQFFFIRFTPSQPKALLWFNLFKMFHLNVGQMSGNLTRVPIHKDKWVIIGTFEIIIFCCLHLLDVKSFWYLVIGFYKENLFFFNCIEKLILEF